MRTTVRWTSWGVMSLLALLMAMLASRYLTLDPAVYFPQQRAVYMAHTAGILMHIVGGIAALLLGPLQFVPAVRRRWPRLHRTTGRVYLAGVALGGLGGLYMARLAFGGLPARTGFALLAVAWLAASAMAYLRIRQGNTSRHREWMIRSYALSFAAPMLRLEQVAFTAAGVEFATAYVAVAWLCWLPNLLAAEGYVRWTRRATTRRLAPL